MTETKERVEIYQRIRSKEASSRLLEIYLWMFAALIVAGGAFIDAMRGAYISEILSMRYIEILFSVLTLLFPMVFKLIFGFLPLEALRRKRAQQPMLASTTAVDPTKEIKSIEAEVLSGTPTPLQLSDYSSFELFSHYSVSSQKLADGIYSRSGVYLLIGVLVAFSGLAFFYGQTVQLPKEPVGINVLLMLAPKFGILFFIEFVAFFFLKQYRAAMDEFRYYEAIKRNREESLALLKVAKESGKSIDPLELIKHDSFFSKAGTLSKDQSTEIIEARKLEKGEMELLEKIIDAVSKSKR